MPKYFTIWEAEDLLKQLSEPLRQAVTARAEFSALESRIQDEARRVFLSGGAVVNQAEAVRLRLRRDALAQRLREIVPQVQEHGCLIKDLEIGLLDFPTLYQGREVYLCWRLGEESIQYWHEVEDGFRGRRLVDADFLAHHRGSTRAS